MQHEAVASHAFFMNSVLSKNMLIVESFHNSVQKWDWSRWCFKARYRGRRHDEPLHQDISIFVNIYNKAKSAQQSQQVWHSVKWLDSFYHYFTHTVNQIHGHDIHKYIWKATMAAF